MAKTSRAQLLVIGALVLALAVPLGSVQAQGTPDADSSSAATGTDWEPTGLASPVMRLFAPRSGAFFAKTQDALLRSDDGGYSWRPVSLPAGAKIQEVDPTNHTNLYAARLYKMNDDAASWKLTLPTDATVGPMVVSRSTITWST